MENKELKNVIYPIIVRQSRDPTISCIELLSIFRQRNFIPCNLFLLNTIFTFQVPDTLQLAKNEDRGDKYLNAFISEVNKTF